MDLSAFRRALEGAPPAPVYVFSGEQDYLRQQALEALRQAAGGGSVRVWRAPEADTGSVAGSLRNLSLLEPIAVVVLREANRLGDELLELAASYENPGGPVLVLDDAKVDRRKKLFAALAKKGAWVELGDPKPAQVRGWLEREAKKRDARLDSGVADLLADLLGRNLKLLETTLETLALSVGDSGTITREVVREMVPAARETPLYELLDAVGEGKTVRALVFFRRILEDGGSPYQLLGGLAAGLRNLLFARSAGGLSDADVARLGRMPPWKVKTLRAQAMKFPERRLEEALVELAEIDVGIKSGTRNPRLALEDWIVRLARPARKAQLSAAGASAGRKSFASRSS